MKIGKLLMVGAMVNAMAAGAYAEPTIVMSTAEAAFVMNIASAYISNIGTVNAQDGQWISSVMLTSTGQFTINITPGVFAAAPNCTVTPQSQQNVNARFPFALTNQSIFVETTTGLGGFTSVAFYITCLGPRI